MEGHAPEPRFQKGDRVQLLSDRSKIGDVIRDPNLLGGAYWYRIKLIEGGITTVHEEDLTAFQVGQSPAELLLQGAFGDKEDFLRLVTFHKLDTPLQNTLYSLQASRTEFYPHQYKPLLKFLDSPHQRLLIADEVGLGKTIEAGLVMIEQRARRALGRVLIVCPAALCVKWQEEMWHRFDEQFAIISAADFRQRLYRLQDEGVPSDSREIISLEAVRNEQHIDLLEVIPMGLDLLIVDEAHHLRNPETLSHKTCAELARGTGAVLLLTATPIQLGEENLFNLFRILDPAEFEDFEIFQERLRANRPVVDSQRLARQVPPPVEEIRHRIDRLGAGPTAEFFGPNPIYHRLKDVLRDASEDGSRTDHALATEIQRDLEELSLLSHVFSRTKKRDVFADATIRQASVIRVVLTPEEREFYDAVTEFVRDSARSEKGAIRYFSTMGAQRQIASSIAASKPKFLDRAVWALDDSLGAEAHDLEQIDRDISVELSERVIDAARALGDMDTKYDELLQLLEDLEKHEPGRKLILFAYYKPTLNYLYERLQRDDVRCELIHGDIRTDPTNPERDERGRRMRRFRDDPDVRLLLSSEVGSEGLDFQFCHIIINYDLPWNPMRVEQRIGRVDRLGQESDRVLIYNFTLHDTIEERVLDRLYTRINIFEQSIGDLETIIGDEISQLTYDLLSSRLTPDEEAERIERTGRALEWKKRELDRLEAESDKLVSRDGYFEEQLARIRQGGELLAAEDREAFFRKFLEHVFPRVGLGAARRKDVFNLTVTEEFELAVRQLPTSAPLLHFLRQIHDGSVQVTFRAETAFKHDDLEFLAAHHPVFQLATEHYRSHREQLHSVAALQLERSENVGAGRYLYLLFGVSIEAGEHRRRLDPLFVKLDVEPFEVVTSEAGSALLGELLRHGVGTEGSGADQATLEAALDVAWDTFEQRLAEARQRTEDRNRAIVQTRLTSLEKAHRNRIGRVKDRLERAERMGQDARIIRLLKGQVRNLEARHAAQRELLEGDMKISMTPELVGCGLVRVLP